MNVTKCDCCGEITLDCIQIRRRDLVIQGVDTYSKTTWIDICQNCLRSIKKYCEEQRKAQNK